MIKSLALLFMLTACASYELVPANHQDMGTFEAREDNSGRLR